MCKTSVFVDMTVFFSIPVYHVLRGFALFVFLKFQLSMIRKPLFHKALWGVCRCVLGKLKTPNQTLRTHITAAQKQAKKQAGKPGTRASI
jgi:hypothetical protein